MNNWRGEWVVSFVYLEPVSVAKNHKLRLILCAGRVSLCSCAHEATDERWKMERMKKDLKAANAINLALVFSVLCIRSASRAIYLFINPILESRWRRSRCENIKHKIDDETECTMFLLNSISIRAIINRAHQIKSNHFQWNAIASEANLLIRSFFIFILQVVLPFRRWQLRECAKTSGAAEQLQSDVGLVFGQTEYCVAIGDLCG